jgi:hypothetical protein
MLLINPPFDMSLSLSHIQHVRHYKKLYKINEPLTIYIYLNQKLLNGSPFLSYPDAHKALGLNSNSNVCNRYVDTSRLYKSKYLLSTKPIDFI